MSAGPVAAVGGMPAHESENMIIPSKIYSGVELYRVSGAPDRWVSTVKHGAQAVSAGTHSSEEEAARAAAAAYLRLGLALPVDLRRFDTGRAPVAPAAAQKRGRPAHTRGRRMERSGSVSSLASDLSSRSRSRSSGSLSSRSSLSTVGSRRSERGRRAQRRREGSRDSFDEFSSDERSRSRSPPRSGGRPRGVRTAASAGRGAPGVPYGMMMPTDATGALFAAAQMSMYPGMVPGMYPGMAGPMGHMGVGPWGVPFPGTPGSQHSTTGSTGTRRGGAKTAKSPRTPRIVGDRNSAANRLAMGNSKYTGVQYRADRKGYVGRVKINRGKAYYVRGSFDSEYECARHVAQLRRMLGRPLPGDLADLPPVEFPPGAYASIFGEMGISGPDGAGGGASPAASSAAGGDGVSPSVGPPSKRVGTGAGAGTSGAAYAPKPAGASGPRPESRYLHVYWAEGKWQASVRHKNKQHPLGGFDSEEEAAAAVAAKCKELGEFLPNGGMRPPKRARAKSAKSKASSETAAAPLQRADAMNLPWPLAGAGAGAGVASGLPGGALGLGAPSTAAGLMLGPTRGVTSSPGGSLDGDGSTAGAYAPSAASKSIDGSVSN